MKLKLVRLFSHTIKVKAAEIRYGELLIKLSNKQREEYQNLLYPLGFKCYHVTAFASTWLHDSIAEFDKIIIGDIEI